MALGRALRKAADTDGAVQAFERAAALVPIATGMNSPHAQLAQIAKERNDRVRMMAELQALMAVDFDNVQVARELASLIREAGITDPVRLQSVYERIASIDPFDAESHAVLGRLAMARDAATTAVREFRAVLALKPVDQAAAHTDLAESYFKAGNRADAKRQTLAALEIAPTYPRAQDLLLKLAESRP
jgi:tetratricopeptide (TPR) repeat protein